MENRNGIFRSRLSPVVAEELLAYIAKQSQKVAVGVVLTATVIAFLARHAPTWIVAGWLIAVLIAAQFRIVALRALHEGLAGMSWEGRLRLVTTLAFATGILHALSAFFWPYLSDLQRALQTLMVTGMCAVTIVSGLGYLRAYVAYVVPMIASVAIAWILEVRSAGSSGAIADAVATAILFAGALVFLVLVARDTFRRFLEAYESRQLLRKALDEAESASRAKTRFLASASHDLRQPMHALSLLAAAMLMRPLDQGARSIVSHIDTGLRMLSSQLDALLDISKLDAGVVPISIADFSAAEMLRRVAANFEVAAANKGLRLELASPADAPARSDPALLERVVRNLVDNAVKYTARGKVRLTLESDGDAHVLRVADSGPGIPEGEQERVFEEFYQVGNPERDRTQGLGLGLSIVRRLSDMLDLRLQMRSTVGEGTAFELRIPAAAALAPVAVAAGQDVLDLHGLHVLVVDDEETVRHAMQALLDAMGCRTTLATSTREALDQTEDGRPDIVLADLRLRGNDSGIRSVGALRERYPDLPALLISGDTAPARLREAHDAGLRLLHKPVLAQALTQAMCQEIDLGRRSHGRSARAA